MSEYNGGSAMKVRKEFFPHQEIPAIHPELTGQCLFYRNKFPSDLPV
jgi:hypothetical protein